eukprot:5792532-Karenia_brevis.AAC.1
MGEQMCQHWHQRALPFDMASFERVPPDVVSSCAVMLACTAKQHIGQTGVRKLAPANDTHLLHKYTCCHIENNRHIHQRIYVSYMQAHIAE